MSPKISAFHRQHPIMFRSPPLTLPVTSRFTPIRSTAATPRIHAHSPLTRSTSPRRQPHPLDRCLRLNTILQREVSHIFTQADLESILAVPSHVADIRRVGCGGGI